MQSVNLILLTNLVCGPLMIGMQITEPLLKMTTERSCKNLCSIVNMVTTVTVNIEKVWAVVFANSCFQPHLTASHYTTGVHYHTHKIGPWDVVILRKPDQHLLKLDSINLKYLQSLGVPHQQCSFLG